MLLGPETQILRLSEVISIPEGFPNRAVGAGLRLVAGAWGLGAKGWGLGAGGRGPGG